MRAVPAVIRRCLADNKLFALALIPAVLLRVDAELGYRWQSWFNDSFSYVSSAVTLTPETSRPSGYPVYLWLLSPFHSYFLVTASQHLMGLLVAVMIYALARRRFAAPAWVAVLATLPVLYDGFEIQLEHLIMTDTLFLFLAFAALTVLLWNPRPSWRACLAAGLLLGLSTTVRSTGLALIPVFALYLLIRFLPGVVRGAAGGGRWRGWRALIAGLVACGIAFAVPIVGYEAWYKSAHGQFTMTESTGVFLYSRVMTFADCSRMTLPVDLLSLCTSVPPAQRPIAQAYIWDAASPLNRFPAAQVHPHGQQAGGAVRDQGRRGAAARLRAGGLGRHRPLVRLEPSGLPQRPDLRRVPVRLPLAGHPRIACSAATRRPRRTTCAATRAPSW